VGKESHRVRVPVYFSGEVCALESNSGEVCALESNSGEVLGFLGRRRGRDEMRLGEACSEV
jgi:hypothetical protein